VAILHDATATPLAPRVRLRIEMLGGAVIVSSPLEPPP